MAQSVVQNSTQMILLLITVHKSMIDSTDEDTQRQGNASWQLSACYDLRDTQWNLPQGNAQAPDCSHGNCSSRIYKQANLQNVEIPTSNGLQTRNSWDFEKSLPRRQGAKQAWWVQLMPFVCSQGWGFFLLPSLSGGTCDSSSQSAQHILLAFMSGVGSDMQSMPGQSK